MTLVWLATCAGDFTIFCCLDKNYECQQEALDRIGLSALTFIRVFLSVVAKTPGQSRNYQFSKAEIHGLTTS